MPRRGENIYKRKDGRWEGRYIKSHDKVGKSIYGFVYAKSYAEVKKKLEDKRKGNTHDTKTTDDFTFEDIAEQWFNYMSLNIKASTAAKYRNFLDKHILPEFGKYSVEEIHTVMIEQFSRQKLQCGRLDGAGGLSAKTVRDMLSVLREIFYYAEKRNAYVTCRVREIHIKQKDSGLRIISKEDQEKLEEYLLMNDTLRNIGILMSLYMGLRIGELCALKWKNILLKERIVQVRSTMQRIQTFAEDESTKTSVIITPPKSACAVRDIPIPAFLAELLEDYESKNEEAFFLTGNDSIYLEPRTFQYYFKRILEINGIPETNYHVLRHYVECF